MTTLRLTAIRCLCRDRDLVRVKDGVVLKKVYRCSVNGNTGDSKPPALSSNLSTYANLSRVGSTVGHRTVNPTLTHSRFDSYTLHQLTRCSSVWLEHSVWGGGVVGSNPTIETKLGELAEWPIALVLKTREPKGSVSSNLTLSANIGV